MEPASEAINQTTMLQAHYLWLTGPYAPYHTVNTVYVDGTRLSRSWWKSQKPWIVTKPYAVTRFRQWPGAYSVSCHFTLYGEAWEYGDSFVSPDAVMSILNNVQPGTAEGEAQNAALKVIAGARWLMPVALAELDKAGKDVKKLADVFYGGHDLMSNAIRFPEFRKGVYRKMRRLLTMHGFGRFVVRLYGTATDAWLAWRYSVQTAILDAQDACKAAAEVLADTPRQTERAHTHRVGPITAVSATTGDGPLRAGFCTTLYARTEYSYTTWTEAEAWITAVRQYNPVTAVPQAVGLLNMPLNLWEMFPGSFVADWVIDLGSYLEGLNALVGWNVVDSGTSVKKRIAGETRPFFMTSNPWTTDISSTSEAIRFEGSIYNRSSWVNPAPVWTPAFRMNTSRWLDAAALVSGLQPLRLKKF